MCNVFCVAHPLVPFFVQRCRQLSRQDPLNLHAASFETSTSEASFRPPALGFMVGTSVTVEGSVSAFCSASVDLEDALLLSARFVLHSHSSCFCSLQSIHNTVGHSLGGQLGLHSHGRLVPERRRTSQNPCISRRHRIMP